MDNRRFVTFLVFFFAFTFIYNGIIAPKFFPQPRPRPVVDNNIDPDDPLDPAQDPAAAAEDTAERHDADGKAADPDKPAAAANLEPAVHPLKTVTLGSLDPASGYFLEVTLTSAGAAVESVRLSDPKFRELTDRDRQLTVLGTNTTEDETFTTAVAAIDRQLKNFQLKLETIAWEVVSADVDQATFSFTSPDQTLRLTKTYRLTKVKGSPEELRNAFLKNSDGYTIQMDLSVTNLSDRPQEIVYELQGPVGIVLENVEHTRKYVDIKIEFKDEDDPVTLAVSEVDRMYNRVLDAGQNQGKAFNETQVRDQIRQSDAWTGTFRYAGVDVQFFAALVAPLKEPAAPDNAAVPGVPQKWVERTYPVMIQKDRANLAASDISFRMVSTPINLEAKGGNDTATHTYALFVGPKRSDLLDPEPFAAAQVLDYGSWFGLVARGMHWILDKLHHMGMPYFLAIISLTVLVRGMMFPLSRKQAIMAAKQKALAPRLQELKLKHGDDKEKFARAQMELWRKHGVNPLGGCLPALVQLPIFIGLYTCLNTAVDLRLSSFLWIDNLAAPDALTTMPRLPVLGSDFNLLPCISVALFLVQQKLFMPPPQDEQAEMTAKMMNMMTIVMGVMFWHVPAGLCIYFIASSLWGIAERKLLGSAGDGQVPQVVVNDPGDRDNGNGQGKAKGKGAAGGNAGANGGNANGGNANVKQGFFGKLMLALEEAQKKAEEAQRQAGKTPDKSDRGKGKKKGR
ncbi:MAG: membrane protein insertase YidC [Planctomycetaceae bacterium]